MTFGVKLEFDKQTYDVWLMEILETFPRVFSFWKSHIKENSGKHPFDFFTKTVSQRFPNLEFLLLIQFVIDKK